jgi:tagatose 1,6-diphosphate aldolase
MRAGIQRDGIPYAQTLHRLLEEHGTPWTACRAFADGVAMADAGPDFFARYPSA